jgi:hypothetical protein
LWPLYDRSYIQVLVGVWNFIAICHHGPVPLPQAPPFPDLDFHCWLLLWLWNPLDLLFHGYGLKWELGPIFIEGRTYVFWILIDCLRNTEIGWFSVLKFWKLLLQLGFELIVSGPWTRQPGHYFICEVFGRIYIYYILNKW